MDNKGASLESLISSQNAILQILTEQLKSGNPFLTTLAIGILVTCIGAAAAYFFNWLHWRKTENQKATSIIASSLSSLITDLEELSFEYWLKESNDSDQVLEIKIKSNLRLISKYSKLYSEKNPESPYTRKITGFSSKVFDEVTGGDFEAKNKKISRPKANRVSRQCTEAKATLHEILVSL